MNKTAEQMVVERFKYMGYIPIVDEYQAFFQFATLNSLDFVESDTFVFFNSELLMTFILGLDISEVRVLSSVRKKRRR